MVVVSCPHCSQKIKARDEFVGKKAKCASCGQTFLVDAPSIDQADFEPLESAEAPIFSRSSAGKTSENRRVRRQNSFHIATIILIVVTCVAVGTTVVMTSRPTPAPTPNADWRMNLPGVGQPEAADSPADSPLFAVLLLVGAAWMVWLIMFGARLKQAETRTAKALAAQKPTHGPIVCGFCDTTVVQDAKWLGQTILCPNCHGTFTAPGGKTQTSGGSSAWTALGVLMLVIGFFGILAGGGLWAFALFGFGVGCVSKGRFWVFFWVR